MNNNNKTVGIIALSLLKGIGPAFVKKAITANSFNSSNHFKELKEITETNNKTFENEILFQSIEKAKDIIAKCNTEGISIIHLLSEKYPLLLKEIKDPPPVIYCIGNLVLLNNRTVCIIGTREPNENGQKISERIGAFYSDSNWNICNGLAEGIDNFSIQLNNQIHKNVIGILAGGLNFKTAKTLLKKTAINAEEVLNRGGLLISENPPDIKEDTFTVVKSCRIQAGLSNGLIIVQSTIDGGSRFTTKSFCETQRPIAVVNPFQKDIELPSYSANKEIILNGKKGLAKFIELKEDKILTSKIFIIKSKDDYSVFENIMNTKQTKNEQSSSTLFD